MKIAGIDPGSFVIATAICDEHGQLVGKLLAEPEISRKKGTRALTRFCPLMLEFRQQLAVTRPDYCYIEEPIYIQSFEATLALGMVVGAMIVILQEMGIPYSLVGNTVWKKALIGRGKKVTKEEIRAWVVARFGIPEDLRQDVYDAIAIAEWGRKNFERD